MRADRKLTFFEQVGPPDERALAAEIEVEADDADNDPEYKPARISFPELEFEVKPFCSNIEIPHLNRNQSI